MRKLTNIAIELSRNDQTVILNAVHNELQHRALSKTEHMALRDLYYKILWGSRMIIDIGDTEAENALKMNNEFDYTDYPIIKRNGKPINAHVFSQAPIIDGVKNK